jgi:S1-C subfamily serine protease
MIGGLLSHNALAAAAGSVLLDDEGRLTAIASPEIGRHAYLPAEVVVSVDRLLASGTPLEHGRLQVSGRTARTGGAEIVHVDQTSPAAGSLAPGDVVVAVGRQAVHSLADLLDLLYMAPARSVVRIEAVRKGVHRVAAVRLAGSP